MEVGPQGADQYEARYANGTMVWTILLDADGKTATAGVRRLPPGQ
jgi:hypothetical protein